MNRIFTDRIAAGRELAEQLRSLHVPDPVVLALPRGGVPVAAEVARALGAPMDLILVRKIGVPWQPELAVAAIVDGGDPQLVIDEEVQRMARIGRDYIDRESKVQLREIERRRVLYLHGRAPLPVAGRSAIVVDDGIATGTTVRAALKALRRRKPARLVLAVPVAPAETIAALRREVDDVVCLSQPEDFRAIGLHYEDFHQLEDREVIEQMAALQAAPGKA